MGAILPPPIDDVIGGDTKRGCARVKEEGGAVSDALFAVGFTNYPIERSREGGRKFKLGSAEPSRHDRSGLLFGLDRWQHHFTNESEGPSFGDINQMNRSSVIPVPSSRRSFCSPSCLPAMAEFERLLTHHSSSVFARSSSRSVSGHHRSQFHHNHVNANSAPRALRQRCELRLFVGSDGPTVWLRQESSAARNASSEGFGPSNKMR